LTTFRSPVSCSFSGMTIKFSSSPGRVWIPLLLRST
jgi:hypothetical protein